MLRAKSADLLQRAKQKQSLSPWCALEFVNPASCCCLNFFHESVDCDRSGSLRHAPTRSFAQRRADHDPPRSRCRAVGCKSKQRNQWFSVTPSTLVVAKPHCLHDTTISQSRAGAQMKPQVAVGVVMKPRLEVDGLSLCNGARNRSAS